MGSRIGETGTLLASWLLLLLPLCKLLASSKAHCKSFSCENFPEHLPPPLAPSPTWLCLHFPGSLCSALTLLASHLLHYIATISLCACLSSWTPRYSRSGMGPSYPWMWSKHLPTHLVLVSGWGDGKDEAGTAHFCPPSHCPGAWSLSYYQRVRMLPWSLFWAHSAGARQLYCPAALARAVHGVKIKLPHRAVGIGGWPGN